MKSKFLNWYTQAFGATLGIFACIYAYMHGDIFVYSNISKYFDELGVDGVIGSYFLLPLCIITLIFAIIKSYAGDKKIFNVSLEFLNKIIIITTVIIGFIGAKIYFIIPAIFILLNMYNPKDEEINNTTDDKSLAFNTYTNKQMYNNEKTTVLNEFTYINDNHSNKISYNMPIHNNSKINQEKEIKILLSKKQIAMDLLSKNSSKQFIREITGFTLEEINDLEKEFKN